MDKKILEKFNRRLLWKHLLSAERQNNLPPESVASSVVGVNSQNLKDSIMSFGARIGNFSEAKYQSAFRPRGNMARTWTVRGTIHTFPSSEYGDHVFGSPCERALRNQDRYARMLKIPGRQERVDFLYMPLLDEISNRAVTSGFISDFISERLEEMGIKGRRRLNRGWSSEEKYGPVWDGMAEMSYMGLLVSAGKEGSASLWMRTMDWLGKETGNPDPLECSSRLVKSYIGTYGPVTLNDIAYWTGHRKVDAKDAVKHLDGDLYEQNFDGSPDTYYSIEDGDDYPQPPEAVILPRFDSIMMGHPDKTRIIPDGLKGKIFTNAGIIKRTVLVNGFAAGIWTGKKSGKLHEITVETFRPLSEKEKKYVRDGFSGYSGFFEGNTRVRFRKAG